MKKIEGLILAMTLGLLAGCETAAPTGPTVRKITCKLPAMVALPETKQAQDKGGVEISVVPVTYTAEQKSKTTRKEVAPNFGESILPHPQGAMMVEETTAPYLETVPDHIQFLVTINNKMPRVFRGAGTVVQFNIGGQLKAVDQSAYLEMIQAIVPPRNQVQLKINGPALSLVADKTTVGLFLYDVVTKQSDAGEVTEKQNFEWYYDYQAKETEASGEAKTVRGWLNPNAR